MTGVEGAGLHRESCEGRTAPRPAPWAARSACSAPASLRFVVPVQMWTAASAVPVQMWTAVAHAHHRGLAATTDAKSVMSCRAPPYNDIQRFAAIRFPIALLYLNRVLVDQVHPPRLRQRRERDERRHQRPHSRADRLGHVIGVCRGGADGYWLCNDDMRNKNHNDEMISDSNTPVLPVDWTATVCRRTGNGRDDTVWPKHTRGNSVVGMGRGYGAGVLPITSAHSMIEPSRGFGLGLRVKG